MFSLIIPVYNEEASVKDVFLEYHHALQALPYPFEIIIVNDCSTDNTAAILKQIPATVITNPRNFGYGKSLKAGIVAARYDNIIITDADSSYPGNLIGTLIEHYGTGNNMTVAAREGKNLNRSVAEKTARLCLKSLIELLANAKVVDVNSGYRIFNRKPFIAFMDKMSDQFSFSTSLTMISSFQSIPLVYVPFEYRTRSGNSKVKYVKDSLKTIQRAFILFYWFRIKRGQTA